MLSFLVDAGYPVLAVAVLVGAFGAPLPLNVALAGAGSLARQGRLDLIALFMICAAAAVAGDCLGYAVGRYGIRRLPLPDRARAWADRLVRGPEGSARVQAPMGMAVFLTRWAVTAPAPLVNVLAGARRYPSRSFLLFDVTGETLWCMTALAPGYLLGASGALSLPLSLGAGAVLAMACMLFSRRHAATMLSQSAS